MRRGRMTAPTAFNIRPAQPSDALALAQLLASVGWFARFETGNAQDHAQRIAPLLQASEHSRQMLACDPQGELLGYCAMHWLPVAVMQSWEAYVSELFIADQARGLGVGAQLLDHAVQAARAQGCSRIWLINNRDRDSYQRGFYAKQGWQEHAQAARFVLPL